MKNIKIIFRYFILTFACSTICLYATAQEDEAVPADTSKFYKKLKEISEKKKLTKMLYDEIFINASDTIINDSVALNKNSKKLYKKTSGKIIRHITYKSLDPVGYEIADSSQKPKSLLEKTVNTLHIKSKNLTLRNHLLFKSGDSLDPLKIKESERIIRTSGYIKDAYIQIIPTKHKDSVDILVVAQDRWSVNGSASVNLREYSGTITNNNFLGLGHNVSQRIYSQAWTDSTVHFQGLYTIPFIKNTFIQASGFYSTDPVNAYKGVSINRPFFSPLTQWAGGLQVAQYSNLVRLRTIDTNTRQLDLDRYNFDIWLNHSIEIIKDKKAKKNILSNEVLRSTRFIYGARYWQEIYNNTLLKTEDPLQIMQSHQTVFTTLGISYRGFYKDRFIFRYGVTEDVPVGRILSYTWGIDFKDDYKRIYNGISLGFAKRFEKFGYLSSKFEVGGYLKDDAIEQGTVSIRLNYFTELLQFKNWKVRQFFTLDNLYGINRGANELLNINNENGLRGFRSPVVVGSNKLVLISQSQFYLPYKFLGFRFAPILYFGIGQVGTEQNIFITQQLIPVIALGMQVRNEMLVFNTFQFIIGLYPVLPGVDSGLFRLNPIRTYDYQFRSFDISRPDVVPYY